MFPRACGAGAESVGRGTESIRTPETASQVASGPGRDSSKAVIYIHKILMHSLC